MGNHSENSVRIKQYAFFKKLCALPYVDEIWLYGSRARGDNQERSDIDLALVCPTASKDEWGEIRQIINEADTLFKIDCVRFDTISEDKPIQNKHP